MEINQLRIVETILFVIIVASSLTGVNTYARPVQGLDEIRIDGSGSPGSPGNRGKRGGPPQEAVESCSSLGESESCAFTSPRGDEITGTCEYVPGDIFACVPEGGPPGGRVPPDDAPPGE